MAYGVFILLDIVLGYAEFLIKSGGIFMKKICFVTAARSEYGLLKWLMKEVESSQVFQLQIVVTGGHLLKEQGYTIGQIRRDGFKIDAAIDVQFDVTSKESIAASMGRMAERMAHTFANLKPDYIAVLGDRYELLPICNTAFMMNIPIIHLCGGDVTEGALDDGIRNAVTMLATYHFPGTEDSAENIRRMLGTNENIWTVGEMSIDSFFREKLISREELSDDLCLDLNKKWVLMTYHPETKESSSYNNNAVEACCTALDAISDIQVIVTYSNADFGGREINDYLLKKASAERKKYIVVSSLGSSRYLSLMKYAEFVIGNSSSGIVEAPALRCPTINIGNRQKGRHFCKSVVQCAPVCEEILSAIHNMMSVKIDYSDADYWGDGHASERMIKILEAMQRL